MTRTMFLLKTEDYIEKLSVMYGVLSVLTDNGVSAKLTNEKSAFVIRSEDFNPEDLIVIPNEVEVDYSLMGSTKMMKQVDYDRILKKMFGEDLDGHDGYFSQPEHLVDMIAYLETQDESYIAKDRHGIPEQSQTFYGSVYGVKGQRGTSKTATNEKIPAPIKFWSTLGFMRATSAITINENIELTWIPIPSQMGVSEVVRYQAFDFRENKEGNPYLPGNMRADSDQIGFAYQFLKMQDWLGNGRTKEEFEGIIYVQTYPAGHSSLNGRVDFFRLLPLSSELIEDLLNKLSPWSNTPYDVKRAVADLVLNRQGSDLTQFIHMLVKNKPKRLKGNIYISHAEELSKMFNQYEIFKNEGVNLFGRALGFMMYDSKGYDVQVALMNVTTAEELTSALALLNMKYERMNSGRKAINLTDLGSLMELVQDNNKVAKNVADMILLRSTSFLDKLKKAEIDTKETVEQDI